MNTKELIIDFINKHATPHDFTGGISEEKITKIENDLQTILPESYKWFLRNYGSGGVYGVDILGYDFGGASVVEFTNEYVLISPTGVALAILPFVILFTFGVGFLVAGTAKRKEDEA